jgi:hypothetical protein
VIDIAPEMQSAHLDRIVRDCLDRKLFTIVQALARLEQRNMTIRVGAHMVRCAPARSDPDA